MESALIQEWIARGEAGKTVWLPEVRERCAAAGDSIPVFFRLDNGREIERAYYFPRWENEQEREFVKEVLCACVYNLLAAFGGRKLTFYVNTNERALVALLEELKEIFQLKSEKRAGYGKTVSVSNRINRSLGREELRFAISDIRGYKPLDRKKTNVRTALPARLKNAAARAGQGRYCGIDVGGTDIKLAGAIDGELAIVQEYDWNPAAFDTAEKIMEPIAALARKCREKLGGAPLDGIGLSFPDVVIRNKIVGGETPKTKGLRENAALEYEEEFAKLSLLEARLKAECREGAQVRLINDGSMTAFTAAVELAAGGEEESLGGGAFALSLGTDLGTGWLKENGSVPEIPLELYDFLLDLGSRPQRSLPAEDIRSVCNENSGLPGVRRYLGQAAAYRLAMEKKPELIRAFVSGEDMPQIIASPADMRKPCLERLMERAEEGDSAAEEIFRQIGRNLGELSREAEFVLGELPQIRYLFGRFVKRARCFALLKEGFEEVVPNVTLAAADEHMAFTGLMKQLGERENATVAQFAQAVGAIYFACMEEER